MDDSVKEIIGATCGGLLLIIIVVSVVIWCYCKKRLKKCCSFRGNVNDVEDQNNAADHELSSAPLPAGQDNKSFQSSSIQLTVRNSFDITTEISGKHQQQIYGMLLKKSQEWKSLQLMEMQKQEQQTKELIRQENLRQEQQRQELQRQENLRQEQMRQSHLLLERNLQGQHLRNDNVGDQQRARGRSRQRERNKTRNRSDSRDQSDHRQGDPNKTLDLHGMHVGEAIQCFMTFVNIMETVYNENNFSRTDRFLYVITGRGLHSRGGIPKIRPAVQGYLDKHDYMYEWNNMGGMVTIDLLSKRKRNPF